MTIAGHIGKIIKIANGQFDTNIKHGDNRLEAIAQCARACGADQSVVADILEQTTAESTIGIIKKCGLTKIFDEITGKAVGQMEEFTRKKILIKCVLLSLNADVLAVYPR